MLLFECLLLRGVYISRGASQCNFVFNTTVLLSFTEPSLPISTPMRSLAVLLLLGVAPAFSWVIPDDDSMHVFQHPRQPLDEVQEMFNAIPTKFKNKLETFVEEIEETLSTPIEAERSVDDDSDNDDVETAIPYSTSKEYLDPLTQWTSGLEFWDTDAWISRFGDIKIDSISDSDEHESIKHHKHHKGKHGKVGKHGHGVNGHGDDGRDDNDPEDGTDP